MGPSPKGERGSQRASQKSPHRRRRRRGASRRGASGSPGPLPAAEELGSPAALSGAAPAAGTSPPSGGGAAPWAPAGTGRGGGSREAAPGTEGAGGPGAAARHAARLVDGEVSNLLSFLTADQCNPDFNDPEARKLGYVSTGKGKKSVASLKTSRLQRLRSRVGLVVFSWPVQALVFLVVMSDMVLTSVSVANVLEEDATVNIVGDVCIVCILAADVCCRWFAEGMGFIFPMADCKMNIFEAVLVPITLAEITVFKHLNIPFPLLRALRPIFRCIRVLRVCLRTAGKGTQYLTRLRHQLSGDRLRFIQDGFDLDLQYISPQIIVMADPTVGSDAILHNPLKDVARFLNERHTNRYLLLNVTEDRRYPLGPFFGRYFKFPIAQDSVPSLDGLKLMVEAVDQWLKADETRVVAVHSKHNQGRVALLVVALMLHRRDHRSAGHALASFEALRRREASDAEHRPTLDSASQLRFLDYFAHACSLRGGLPARTARIKRVQVSGVPNAHLLDLRGFAHPGEAERGSCVARASAEERSGMMARGDRAAGDASEARVPLQQRVLHAIEEGAVDSRRAGCAPLPGRPVFASGLGLADAHRVAVKTVQSPDTGATVARIWEVHDVELSGEVRLEVHVAGAGPDEEGEPSGEAAQAGGQAAAGVSWRRCCCRRRQEGLGGNFRGMLFGCWLHTALLERDEARDRRAAHQSHRLEISFKRFSLDKAANAPSLRALSTTLRLDIEFHVERRVQLQDLATSPRASLVVSNVSLSEPESLRWLTWVSEQIWPKFRVGLGKMVRDAVEDARPSLPLPMRSLAVVECSFGSAHPQFGPILAGSRSHRHVKEHGHDGLEVQLDIGLKYSTDANIKLQLGVMPFGISHIEVNGVLSLRFTPLLDEMPVFSAMQLFFLTPPQVSIRFSDMLEVANTPFIMQQIRAAIDHAIHDRLVLPNALGINWADPSNDETVTWPTVLPSYVVRVSVHRASDLCSSSTMRTRGPDAYAVVSVGGRRVRTRTVSGKSLTWAESFDFVIYDTRQHFQVEVFDVDFAGKSWPIGKTKESQVEHAAAGSSSGQWWALEGAPAGAAGHVLLAVDLFDLAPHSSSLPPEALLRPPTPAAGGASRGSPAWPPGGGETTRSFRGAGLLQALQEASPCWPRPAAVHRQPSAQPRSPEGDFVIVPMPPDGPNGGSPADQAGAELAAAGQRRAGSVALLVCDVAGGHLPGGLGQPCGVEVVLSFGEAWTRTPCQDAAAGSGGTLPEDTQRRVERLAQKDYSAAEIAEALGEEVADVARCLRKSNHNLRVQHQLFLHLRPSDFTDSWRIRFSIVSASRGRKVLAEGSFPLSALLESSTGKQDGEVVCSSVDGHEVKLDVELGLLVLIPRTEEGADQQCSPGTDESVFLDGHRGAPSMLKRQTTRALGSISKKSFETCCMRALRSPSAMTTAGPRATASPSGPLPVIVGRTRSQAV